MSYRVAVLGMPIAHSRSPAMHNAAFAALGVAGRMDAIACGVDELASTLRRLAAEGVLGASLTLPLKEAAVACCDELDRAAKMIGAVNCVTFEEGRIYGSNTDADGFADALAEVRPSLRDQRVVLLGAGGAARAVAWGVREARAVEVVARRPEAVTWTRAWPWTPPYLEECLARADILVDCTSAALVDDDTAFAQGVPLEALAPTSLVASLVYHRTQALLTRAAQQGLSTMDGRAMLLYQATRAFALWTRVEPPVAAMRAALV